PADRHHPHPVLQRRVDRRSRRMQPLPGGVQPRRQPPGRRTRGGNAEVLRQEGRYAAGARIPRCNRVRDDVGNRAQHARPSSRRRRTRAAGEQEREVAVVDARLRSERLGMDCRRRRGALGWCWRTTIFVIATISTCVLWPDGVALATCAPGRVRISVRNRRGGATPTTVAVAGRLSANTCPADSAGATAYTHNLTIPATCSKTCTCGGANRCTCEPGGIPRCEYAVAHLAPGEWLHGLEVATTAQG